MRQLRRLFAVAMVLASASALADPNDFQLNQGPSGPTFLGNPTAGGPGYSPAANGNFRAFAKEFAAALSGYTLTGTHTLGYNGYAISAELGVANFSSDVTLPTEKVHSGAMLLPSLHVRKGLPWSMELGGRATWIEKSKMAAGTIEGRWAITEGYRMLPEVTLRAYGTKLFNAHDLNLWTAGTDLSVGKRFAIGGMVTLAPYVGWNLGFDHAATSALDFNPGRDETTTETSPTAALADTAPYASLAAAHNSHNRFYLGARFVGGAISIAAELSIANLGTIDEPDPAQAGSTSRSLPSLFTFSTALGLDF
jgi:hypothetical protein